MPTSPTCGLGGPPGSGPCTGTLGINQAPGQVLNGLSAASGITGMLAAGLLIAGLLFAIWAVRKVGTFFGATWARSKADRLLQKKNVAAADALNAGFDWSAYAVARSYMPDVDQGGSDGSDRLAYDEDGDTEDDSPIEDSEESETEQIAPLVQGQAEDVYSKPGAELSDAEFDQLEWAVEWDRENGEKA